MPALSIIPASAVADAAVTDTQLRVLCAIGTFANRLGGNVWASIHTLAKACQLSPRTIQRAIPALIAAGYLRRIDRPGRTPIYEIVLESAPEGVTQESPGGDIVVTPPTPQLSHPNDKKNDKTNVFREGAQYVARMIWTTYPARDTPHLWPPAIRAIEGVLAEGADPNALIAAAYDYADESRKQGTEPRYVKTIARFYSDGAWKHYASVIKVHGRTREEWARSGQDVLEFDLLAKDLPV